MGNPDQITGSVGNGGKNTAADVKVVQRLLMASLGSYGPLRPLTSAGVCDRDTIEAILQFQRNAMGAKAPDGRVDPNGKTMAGLVARSRGLPIPAPWVPTVSRPSGHSISEDGLKFIGHREALVKKLYNDAAGLATIGYGHLVHRGKVGTNATAEAPYVNGITADAALLLLRQDAQIHVNAVNTAVTKPLSQNQFDAIVSLSFNIGAGAMGGSSLIKQINTGTYTPEQIRHFFGLWNKAGGAVNPGLVMRRGMEATLFNDGTY